MAEARQIIVVPDQTALAEAAAARMLARVRDDAGEIAICLTGGSTPKVLYQLLATPNWRARLPWQRMHWFIGDERFVPHDDPLSNIGMARTAFLDACAPPERVHPIATDVRDPDAAARDYEETLRSLQREILFDLVLMGVGPDGHTASLFPGDVVAQETERWVVAVPKAHVAPFVPRVTLTFPTLASCREMLFLISGRDKQAIVTQAMSDETLPANRARSQGETVWLIDQAAAPDHSHA